MFEDLFVYGGADTLRKWSVRGYILGAALAYNPYALLCSLVSSKWILNDPEISDSKYGWMKTLTMTET